MTRTFFFSWNTNTVNHDEYPGNCNFYTDLKDYICQLSFKDCVTSLDYLKVILFKKSLVYIWRMRLQFFKLPPHFLLGLGSSSN
jgi:hypothetical protein